MSDDRLESLRARTRYTPADVEQRVFARWEEAGLFRGETGGDAGESFSIAVPPPNVTGVLHMGHALNASIQDSLARLARMRGRRTKWIYGTDHAGIGTQVKVEQALAAEGKTKEDLGREAFAERVWEWREEHGSAITEQFKRIGASLDYSDERFTMDDEYVRAVRHVFVALYEKGLVTRGHYMVNWDPGTRSAISDLEVEQREMEDTLYSIDYPLSSGSGAITVATVRPETMLADTAIAVNPGDERYTRLIGESAVLPLVGRRLPIVADEHVRTDFGTGALKVTPGHDPNDFEIGKRHGLEVVSVIGEDGCMSAAAGERFRGLATADAQREVVAALREEGLISGTRPYAHDVPHSQRSGMRIEPLISLQWFCDMEKLAAPAIAAVKAGSLRFHPEKPWTGVYLDWLENIRPWCVSRQLWWGHRLPVWYRKAKDLASMPNPSGGDEIHVGLEGPEGEGWEQDPDVLDTWFSSALWPFATLGWPEQTPQLRAFYPTDVLSTARDIIFLWVARMVMFGVEFTGQLPFTDVPIHSVIQAPDGRRMSKSLGTGIDPLDEIEKHGADAVRFGLLAMSSTQDVRYAPGRVEQGLDLANKLWNASRFILLGVQEGVEPSPDHAETIEDRWILSRLERITEQATERLDSFEFAAAALELYEVFWSELCDRYLELAKPRLHAKEGDRTAVSATLLFALDRMLRLLHPLMPHVTEEVWSFLPGERDLLARAEWPVADPERIDERAEAEVERTMEAVTAIRRARDEAGVKPSAILPARLSAEGYGEMRGQLAFLARLALRAEDGDESVAEVPVPGGALELLPSEDFDPQESVRRAAKQREKVEDEIARLESKLANERFTERAPAEVVEGERAKLETYRSALARFDGTDSKDSTSLPNPSG
ncbi:MAG: valine--tRNA ligase [Thermoleophilaceae bacterium]|nr:valine--tRNA ligase [Thermoleophilaceae bacterium]